jgi:hypothetical protein
VPVPVDLPPPPGMPALAREVPVVAIEHISAIIGLGDENVLDVASGDVGLAHAAFVEAEIPVLAVDRGWFAGARWGIVGAHSPGRPSHTLAASPEVWWRVAAIGESGIASGARLGLVLPVVRDLDDDEEATLRTARVVRPADDILLRDRSPALRPALDLRWTAGHVVVQTRQGIDLSYTAAGGGRADLVAHGALFAGVRPDEELVVGLELKEVYVLTEELDDDARAAVSFGPGMRGRIGPVAPALSLEIPVATPLGGEARAYVAVRLGVELELR